jgi:transcriptional regulator with XRE-family HTH domain
VLENIARNLRRLRRERDLTQTQLARLVSIRQQELSAIEHGLQPKLALVDRLARVLGVHPDELLRNSAEQRPPMARKARAATKDGAEPVRAEAGSIGA